MSTSEIGEMDEVLLTQLLAKIHKLTGITMGASKKAMLQVRLRPRMRELNLPSYAEYLRHLEASKDEVQIFINLITTNETSFFRTQRVWDFFQKEFLPQWVKDSPGKVLKIWSAAASSGEESYTIAMCCEEFKLLHKSFEYQIFGSDISSEVLSLAEKGFYSGRSIETLKTQFPARLAKFFSPKDSGYEVNADLRKRVRFQKRNLFEAGSPKDVYDLVFLRNVLIYFEAKDQEIVLANVGAHVGSKGLLVIGESESLNSLKVPFQYRQPLVYGKAESSRAA